MSAKNLLEDCLQNLSDDQFETFINKLLDREDPRISEEQVKGRGRLEVVEVMVNVFSEETVLNVAVEVLQKAKLVKLAPELVAAAVTRAEEAAARRIGAAEAEDAPAGVSAAPDPTFMVNTDSGGSSPECADISDTSVYVEYRDRDPWSNNHSSAFVEKYRMKLIGNVPDPDPLLDLLRHKKVLSDHSYSEIKALPTDDRKMSHLLMGPYLKTKPSCDIFYDYLKKEHPYLVLDLLQN